MEDFESGSLTGWNNGRLDSSSGFTQFLGRFAKNEPDPWKYYRDIPTDALYVTLMFDFYEIDAWDKDDQDCLYVLIDGNRVNFGIFDQHRDDGPRSGSEHGITWSIGNSASPTNIGFSSSKDQKHSVTMRIPSSLFSDGKIKLQFDTRVTSTNKNHESAGFDNIKWVARINCPGAPTPSPLPCPSPRYFPTETFSSDTHGWRNARRDTGGGFGTFLGRYAHGDPIPYKDYTGIPTSVDKVRFMVDFYEIDSWDLSSPNGPDCIYIWVDDTRLFLGYFGSSNNEGNRSGSKDGITWESSALDTPKQIGFGSAYDQKHTIKVFIPPSFYADGKIRIRLQTVVNGNKHDESSGWDNIKLAYLYFCHRRLAGSREGSHLRDAVRPGDQIEFDESDVFGGNDVGRGLAADPLTALDKSEMTGNAEAALENESTVSEDKLDASFTQMLRGILW